MKVVALVEQSLAVIPTVIGFLRYSFSTVLTEREREQKLRGNVICSSESSAGVVGPCKCAVERRSTQVVSPLLYFHYPLWQRLTLASFLLMLLKKCSCLPRKRQDRKFSCSDRLKISWLQAPAVYALNYEFQN